MHLTFITFEQQLKCNFIFPKWYISSYCSYSTCIKVMKPCMSDVLNLMQTRKAKVFFSFLISWKGSNAYSLLCQKHKKANRILANFPNGQMHKSTLGEFPIVLFYLYSSVICLYESFWFSYINKILCKNIVLVSQLLS